MDSAIPRVFLVEGDRQIADCALEALYKSRPDAVVSWVRDGQEALDFVYYERRFANKQDSLTLNLLLIDVSVPGVPALEVVRQLRATELMRLVPIVLLATPVEIQLAQRGYTL